MDSVRIALNIAAFNDFDMLDCDIQNAYLTADCRERVRVISGPEFGSEAGNNMLARNSLYGLKSSGAAFRSFLADTLDAMSYWTRYANPELWFRPEVKPDVFDYFEYILCYVDNMLCISHNTRKLMKRIEDSMLST